MQVVTHRLNYLFRSTKGLILVAIALISLVTAIWGMLSGMTELVVGIPLTIATAQQLGRFSLFALAPIACLALLVLLVWPNLWQRLTGSNE
ncbi:MAG: hypothetical protein AB1345_05620 [Chloroflexota bacterium]